MNRTQAIIRMHSRNKQQWFYVPWIILMSSFVVNLIIGAINPAGEGTYTGGLVSIFIYTFVIGILSFVQTFPFALGLSVRRKDYYWGTIASAVGAFAITALLLFLFSIAESEWTNYWGVNLHFFELPYWSDGSSINRFWIPLLLLLNQFVLGFAIGGFYRRFGKIGMLVIAIAFIVLGTLASFLLVTNGYWANLFDWFGDQTMAELALYTLPITVLLGGLAYWFIRRATA
ncbi:conserved hypothetical protein [Paenibacillus curdlanolyticus YK9]|uniref:Uncharacterized protein n=1 Tax=Paenibacillus curdlanolyticus YK9 TaxID=717606 RepID=E0I379_9BACL|nr:hypothetical protein [Paenibacillus curdlanolyticus]EFM12743.1 conserved hypothetical protein [Paenibacillus curdlanolyticus YK9]